MTAPVPMKKLCMAKPLVRCSLGSISPTKARKGSILMLMEASSSQSISTAIHRAVELGIKKRATVASRAPTAKKGRRRPQRSLQVRSL